MKANQVLKSAAAFTALSIFLVGCGSGSLDTTTSTANSLPAASTNTGSIDTSSSGISTTSDTTIGTGTNDNTDSQNATLNAMNAKLDSIAKDASSAKKSSKKNESSLSLFKWIGLGLAGFLAAKMVMSGYQIYKSQDALTDATGTDQRSWMSILGNGFLMNDGVATSNNAQAASIKAGKETQTVVTNAAANTDGLVNQVGGVAAADFAANRYGFAHSDATMMDNRLVNDRQHANTQRIEKDIKADTGNLRAAPAPIALPDAEAVKAKIGALKAQADAIHGQIDAAKTNKNLAKTLAEQLSGNAKALDDVKKEASLVNLGSDANLAAAIKTTSDDKSVADTLNK